MKASCLCGQVEFEFNEPAGPFELCHCNRCRKMSGSAYAAMLTANTDGYRVVRGKQKIRSFAAPLLQGPPAYKTWFCTNCGSPVPDPEPDGDSVEIPAGIIDGATKVKPDKHIYVDLKADWDSIADGIRAFTRSEIREFRQKYGRIIARQLPSGS